MTTTPIPKHHQAERMALQLQWRAAVRSLELAMHMAERDGDQVKVSPIVVDRDPGQLLRVARPEDSLHSAVMPAGTWQGLPDADVRAVGEQLVRSEGRPYRMVASTDITPKTT